MIGIRVDANENIAMGHLMRCMSIAKQLQFIKEDVTFIISEKYSEKFIIDNGFLCVCLENDYTCKDREVEEMVKIIRKENIDKLIIDSYEVTYQYLYKLHKLAKIIYLDDINKFQYPVDVIINYSYNASMKEYADKNYDGVKFLLGNNYVPLRREFSQTGISIKKNVETVFITTGGNDQYGMIVNILDALQKSELNYLKKVIVVGKFYNDMDKLMKYVKKDDSITIYKNIDNMCEVMHQGDIAISAGGTTLAELCACGLPTICFSVADNQLNGTKSYSENGLMIYAGDVRNKKEQVTTSIVNGIKILANDYQLRKDMSHRVKSIIDGNGAVRIAEIIKAMP